MTRWVRRPKSSQQLALCSRIVLAWAAGATNTEVAAQLGVSRPTAGSASECGARIEREIQIDAPIERVWSLVSEPGWWIGDGDPSSRVATREGDLVVVTTHPHGRFPVLPISAGPPQYASYRGSEDPPRPLRRAGFAKRDAERASV